MNEGLGEQLAWLRASALSFDAGVTSESKRIAAGVRTLVHDTSASTGLLSQLGMRDSIVWRSAVPTKGNDFAGPPWSDSQNEPGFRDIRGMPAYDCTFDQWWRGALFTYNDIPISRSWIVLHTANFDGGAHVDPVLPANYRSLTRDGGLDPVRINSVGARYPDHSNPVPSALRTICTEIVVSIERSR